MCIQQGKPGGRHSVANAPSREGVGQLSSLMTHIQKFHRNILITPVKCGCDGGGNKLHAPEGYTYFFQFRIHIRGVVKRTGETYYNIHYRARKAREEAILKRHDDFANDLNEAIEMSASRRRVSLDLNA